MSHHGVRWDARPAAVAAPGRHATVELAPVPGYLLRRRGWWLAPLVVVATTAVILAATVGYAWTVLHDTRPIVLASLGLAAGVHTAVAIEYVVLRRATRGHR